MATLFLGSFCSRRLRSVSGRGRQSWRRGRCVVMNGGRCRTRGWSTSRSRCCTGSRSWVTRWSTRRCWSGTGWSRSSTDRSTRIALRLTQRELRQRWHAQLRHLDFWHLPAALLRSTFASTITCRANSIHAQNHCRNCRTRDELLHRHYSESEGTSSAQTESGNINFEGEREGSESSHQIVQSG